MQVVLAGGASTDYMVPEVEAEGLEQIGTRRVRLINVDIDNLVGIAPDGTLQLQWSDLLNRGLALCREHKWIPHIIIGHVVPPALALKTPDGRTYGPSSWTVYDEYIYAFLDYVIVSQGFVETEWEVGNEMDIPSQNWVAPVVPTSSSDPAGFAAYSTLYSRIASVADNFRRQHPGIVLRIGGPAAAVDWAPQFVDLVTRSSVPADFVSLHVYGNQLTGHTFQYDISSLQQKIDTQQLKLPISVTEWGPNTSSKLNFEPIAGAFVLDFASNMTQAGISDAIFLSLSQFPSVNWPTLYSTDQTPTDIMIAFESLASLKGVQGTCTSNAELSCVAVTGEDGTVSLVFWNFTWASSSFPDAMTPANATFAITVQPGTSAALAYSIQTAELGSAPWDQSGNPIVLATSGNDIKLNLQIPDGSYGKIELKPN